MTEAASSVVIRGLDAQTFSEMESFVKDLEARPTERLLRDLVQLAELSATKMSLVSYVMVSRYRRSDGQQKNVIRKSVAAAMEGLADGETRDRLAAILDRMSSRA
jgi:hypothetical protein